MAIETSGTVRMTGDSGPPVPVHVVADAGRLRLVSGEEVIGDWLVTEIGFSAQADGFLIRVEGEEFYLRAEEDAAVAEELGVMAASPRMARKVAALHNPDRPLLEPDDTQPVKTRVGALGFALAGAMVLLGGTLLGLSGSSSGEPRAVPQSGDVDPGDFWIAFLVGGLLMVAVSWVMSMGRRWARVVAALVLTGVVLTFGYVISNSEVDSGLLTAYGFIAGGMVVAVAVLFSGSIRNTE